MFEHEYTFQTSRIYTATVHVSERYSSVTIMTYNCSNSVAVIVDKSGTMKIAAMEL